MPPLTLLNTKKVWFTSFALNPYKGDQMTFWLRASWNSWGNMFIKMDKWSIHVQATDRPTNPLRRAQINERTVHGKSSHFELCVVAALMFVLVECCVAVGFPHAEPDMSSAGREVPTRTQNVHLLVPGREGELHLKWNMRMDWSFEFYLFVWGIGCGVSWQRNGKSHVEPLYILTP